MNSKELKRWLAKRGCSFDESLGKGSHIKVYYENQWSVLPMHSKDLPKGTVRAIIKQLGLEDK